MPLRKHVRDAQGDRAGSVTAFPREDKARELHGIIDVESIKEKRRNDSQVSGREELK